MLTRELRDLNKRRDTFRLRIGHLTIVKTSTLSKPMSRIPIKISTTTKKIIDKTVLKFVWEVSGARTPETS